MKIKLGLPIKIPLPGLLEGIEAAPEIGLEFGARTRIAANSPAGSMRNERTRGPSLLPPPPCTAP